MAKRRVQLMIDPKLYIRIKTLAASLDLSYSQFTENVLREKVEQIEKGMSNKKLLP